MNCLKNCFFLLLSLIISTTLSAQTDHAPWQAPYVGSDSTLLYLPDAKAIYWRYGWTRTVGDKNGIVINGEFPDVRYFSYNVYNDDIKMSTGSFTDFQLKPNVGSDNPFQGNQLAKGGSYTLYIVPEGTEIKESNVLYFPDSLTNISIFLRHYLADDGLLGNHPLPKLQAYNPLTNTAIAAPQSNEIPSLSKAEAQKYLVPMFKTFAEEFENNPQATVAKIQHRNKDITMKEIVCRQVAAGAFNHFHEGQPLISYNFQTTGTYPNNDNYYLTIPVERTNDDVVLVKFKAPDYPKSTTAYPNAPVRYFSFSQGDDITYNYGTIADKDFIVSEDGFIYVLVGDKETAISAKAKSLNINYMPWMTGEKMLLVYRHMLPAKNYEHGINQVPIYDNNNDDEAGQAASVTIGEYAPLGKFFGKEAFLKMNAIPAF